MRQYNANDIRDMCMQYEQHLTHVIVAHTHHRPYVAASTYGPYKGVKADAYLRAKLAQTSKDTRHALNCFAKLLYPDATNKPVRHPLLYRPLTFVTIEGANETLDRSQTIHVNITLGNLPPVLTASDVETLFKHAWHDKAHQSDNVKALNYFPNNIGRDWTSYTLKEAHYDKQKAWDTSGIFDVTNCWIPHAALSED